MNGGTARCAAAAGPVTRRQRWQTFVLCLLGWLFDRYEMMLLVRWGITLRPD